MSKESVYVVSMYVEYSSSPSSLLTLHFPAFCFFIATSFFSSDITHSLLSSHSLPYFHFFLSSRPLFLPLPLSLSSPSLPFLPTSSCPSPFLPAPFPPCLELRPHHPKDKSLISECGRIRDMANVRCRVNEALHKTTEMVRSLAPVGYT